MESGNGRARSEMLKMLEMLSVLSRGVRETSVRRDAGLGLTSPRRAWSGPCGYMCVCVAATGDSGRRDRESAIDICGE